MLDQIFRSATQSVRAVAKLPESGVARPTDHVAEHFAPVIVVDVEALLAGLTSRAFANFAALTGTHSADDLIHLVSKPEHASATANNSNCVLLWVSTFPRAFLCQELRLLFRGSHDALQVSAFLFRFAPAAVRTRFRCCARSNTKPSDWQAAFARSADARLADFVPARQTELRDDAFQAATPAGTPVVADPMTINTTPLCDVLRPETTLEAFFCGRQLATSTMGAFVVEFPVPVGVQAEPAAVWRAAPSKRFDGRSRAGSSVEHFLFDGCVLVCIRTSKELSS